ncbi:MAG TPA: dTDP-4-dehydrorhamnose 3,5-epimerase [Bacillota bacterium]|nr:dTDP-4-dehydrorhamnose 3,5-epimerase [Bacillota bacterium]
MIQLTPTILPGCYEIQPKLIKDERGYFVKTFHEDVFRQNGLVTHFAEEYYSYSNKNVLRGLHFQVPPMEHTKMVYCLSGRVLDVIVDLRCGSPTYGKYVMIDLDAEKANMVYIPQGLAHGFYVIGPHAILQYKVTSVYSPEHDSGILWSSAGIEWPDFNPVVSKRDQSFPSFEAFKSPFKY